MITHIEKPILASELSKIFALNTMLKSERKFVHSILEELNQKKNLVELDDEDRNTLIDILRKHMN